MRKTILVIFILSVAAGQAQEYRRQHFVLVNGVNLWYEVVGSGQPIVFISGGPGFSHVYFKPHFAKLAKNFRLIYYDGVGRGRSDFDPDSNYSIARDVADLDGLRQALHLEKWHVYGHSYGGIVAQQYALEHQDNLYSLILSNTMHSYEMWQKGTDNFYAEIQNQYPDEWQAFKQLAEQQQIAHSIDPPDRPSLPTLPLAYFYDVSNLQKLTTDSLPWNEQVYYDIVGDDILKLSPRLKTLDFRPRLREIDVPMLILAGRYDRVAMPRYEVQYLKLAPQAEFYMFEKSGHFPFVEETEKNMQIIGEFLRRTSQ